MKADDDSAAPSTRDTFTFDLPCPHVVERAVDAVEIDAFGHVNNTVYLRWMEDCAWSHSSAVGVPIEACVQLHRRGMAVRRSEINYLQPAGRGDHVAVATWVTAADRLRAVRRFQVVRLADELTLARGRLSFVCINLDTGAPARMPSALHNAYRPLDEVVGVLRRSHGGDEPVLKADGTDQRS